MKEIYQQTVEEVLERVNGKNLFYRLLAYQKEAEKIIRKQPSRHMIRK